MMAILKRKKQKQTQINDDAINTNVILPDEDQDKLAKSDAVLNPDKLDAMPSVNSTGRDTGNSKKLQMAFIIVIGMAIILAGLAATMGRHKEAQKAAAIAEAEKAAAAQKNMSTTSAVDINRDKEKIQAENQFDNLPPPADFNETNVAMNEPVMTAPIEPIVAPTPEPIPRYANDEPMVAGRDYAAPAPIQAPSSPMPSQPMGISPPPTVVEFTPPPPKGSNSSVLVDVNAVRAASVSTNNQEESQLAQSLKPTVVADTRAASRGNTDMLLMRGTTIPCVLKTKIDSTYQGFTVCQINRDVYSANGKTLLIERGSTVFGEQKTEVQHGQARVAVLWTRIETPKNISINIDSPAAGSLGEAGVGARINNHFWKRFGASIMLSMIQDGLAVATSRLEEKTESTGNNNTTVTNSSNTVESMAEKALDNTINMPPTAIVHQGSVINIMVARDVDFASVYSLKRRG